MGMALPPVVLRRLGGQRGSAAVTAVRLTSAILVPKAVFMVSMNLLATTA